MGKHKKAVSEEVSKAIDEVLERKDLPQHQQNYWRRMRAKADKMNGDKPVRGLLRGLFGDGDQDG